MLKDMNSDVAVPWMWRGNMWSMQSVMTDQYLSVPEPTSHARILAMKGSLSSLPSTLCSTLRRWSKPVLVTPRLYPAAVELKWQAVRSKRILKEGNFSFSDLQRKSIIKERQWKTTLNKTHTHHLESRVLRFHHNIFLKKHSYCFDCSGP